MSILVNFKVSLQNSMEFDFFNHKPVEVVGFKVAAHISDFSSALSVTLLSLVLL